MLVIRHGERVDQVFGKSWLQQCTTADGRLSPDDSRHPTCPRGTLNPNSLSCGATAAELLWEMAVPQGFGVACMDMETHPHTHWSRV